MKIVQNLKPKSPYAEMQNKRGKYFKKEYKSKIKFVSYRFGTISGSV